MFSSMIAKLVLPLTVLAALSSCTAVAPDPFLTTQAVEPEAPPAITDVSAEYAAAYLPTYADAIQSVRQTVANNSLHQEIVYANQTALSGENVLTVQIGAPEEGEFLRPPSAWKVRTEMRSALSGLDPAISPIIGNNAAGAYGYATATTGAGSCIYAWQYVKQVTPADSTGFAKFTRRHLAASIRLRYCHPAIPAGRIHVLMDGLRLKDMNSQTIDMLRFAASSADVAEPQAVVTSEPVVRRRKVVRKAAETVDEDWRRPQKDKVSGDAPPTFIDNAAAVPLPDGAVVQPVTVVPGDESQAKSPRRIGDAATVPLPQ